MSGAERIKVLRIPIERNHYQNLSVAGLGGFDIDTTRVDYQDLRIASGFLTHDILHIDWLDGFVRTTKGLRQRARAQTLLAVALAGCIVTRRPVFWTLHNAEPHSGAGRAWRAWKRVMTKAATDVVALSPAAAGHARAIGVKGSLVESGFGSFLGVHPPVPRDVARARWAPSGESVVLIHFGQIRGQKGVADVLEVMRDVEGDDVRLIVAGPVTDQRLSQSLADAEAADRRVTVVGRFLSDEDLGSLLSAADVALMPFHGSLTTSSAHVAAEFGVAVVAPDVELFHPYGSAYLYPPDEGSRGFVEATRRAIGDARSGRLGRRRIVAPPWEDVVEPVAQAYRRALERPFPRRFERETR